MRGQSCNSCNWTERLEKVNHVWVPLIKKYGFHGRTTWPLIIRSKLQKINTRPRRVINGNKPCNKPCEACPFVENTRTVKSTATNLTVNINAPISCDTTWLIYVVNCQKRGCGQQYVGKTERSLRKRFLEHKGYVINKMFEKATGYHFNTKNHDVCDMTITALEKIYTKDTFFIEEKEREWIRSFNTKYKGMNRSCWSNILKKLIFCMTISYWFFCLFLMTIFCSIWIVWWCKFLCLRKY